MKAKRLPKGGTIGIFCPSGVPNMELHNSAVSKIKRLGFKVKQSANFQKSTYGYAASAEERATDFNDLVADDSVHMILFEGGSCAVEILSLIDYENIRCNPKLICSFSDATSILNAIYAQTGLITYYGISLKEFADLRHYNYTQFCSHFVEGYSAKQFVSDCSWRTLRGGSCEGILIGGFSLLFGLVLSNENFKYESSGKYLLFVEDHEKYSKVSEVSTYLNFIGQSIFMQNVVGLIFGHYSIDVPNEVLGCLERFGSKYSIPVVYTDDFGHGTRRAIVPIGAKAILDADNHKLIFVNCEEG